MARYRRDYGPSGGRGSSDGLVSLLAGMVAAAIFDYFMSGNLTQPMGYVQSVKGKKVVVTTGDYLQLGVGGLLGIYGFTGAGRSSRLPAFAYGMGITQIVTKFIFPSVGVPRYVFADIDSKGRIVKV